MKQGGYWNVGTFAFIFGVLGCIVALVSMLHSHQPDAGGLSDLLSGLVAVAAGAVAGATIALARNAFFP